MNNEEIDQYCSENEPIEVIRDAVGRWVKRIWDNGITEKYTYKYDVELLLNNKDITKYKNSFDVEIVERKEAMNG